MPVQPKNVQGRRWNRPLGSILYRSLTNIPVRINTERPNITCVLSESGGHTEGSFRGVEEQMGDLKLSLLILLTGDLESFLLILLKL